MFWETFSELCAGKKVKPGRVAKEIGVSNSAATHWKNGKVPHYDTLLKIADYFGVSVDYLLGKPPCDAGEETLLQKGIDILSSLPPEKQKEMVALLEFMADKEKKRKTERGAESSF